LKSMISVANFAQVKPHNFEYLRNSLLEQDIELVSRFASVFGYYVAQIPKKLSYSEAAGHYCLEFRYNTS